FIVGGPVGDFELLLCHGTVCVVGKMRDLILQLSKSSIYSTKPTTSKGPVIFRQVRYGMDGKPIKVWKFRSMTVMENDDKVIQATKNDIRVTKVGKFLRSTSLDELPQFFNVLFGQMSVVGPRPHAVSHNEQYRSLIQGYMLRHKVKPGITGLAQINGWRGETDTLEKMEKRIEYDLLYIRGWSIWLDLKIIFLTVFKGFINKSAY
ncbi:sugar transferase, partial [Escherichia coli]